MRQRADTFDMISEISKPTKSSNEGFDLKRYAKVSGRYYLKNCKNILYQASALREV